MSTRPDPAQSGLEEEERSEGSTLEESGDSDGSRNQRNPEGSRASREKNTGAACNDPSCSDKLDFIADDDENVKKVDIKPVTRGRSAAKKETVPKPSVKRRRVSLDESKLRKQPARIKKQNLVPKQKRYSVTY